MKAQLVIYANVHAGKRRGQDIFKGHLKANEVEEALSQGLTLNTSITGRTSSAITATSIYRHKKTQCWFKNKALNVDKEAEVNHFFMDNSGQAEEQENVRFVRID